MAQRGYPNLQFVKDSIRQLYRCLKPANVKSFSNDSLYQDARNISWSDPVIVTQHLARLVALQYQLPVTTVIVTFRSDLSIPGRVELSGSSAFFVDINDEHKYNRDSITAILAHEIAHIYLHQQRIRLEPEFVNEVLTDTTAAYLGCGIPLLNGVTETTRSVGYNRIETQSRHFGYLTLDEFGYVLAKRDLLHGYDSSRFLKSGLATDGYMSGRDYVKAEQICRPLVPRPLTDRALHWLQDRIRRKNIHCIEVIPCIDFRCPCCSQSLRIPSSRSIIVVRCPICDSHFRCYS